MTPAPSGERVVRVDDDGRMIRIYERHVRGHLVLVELRRKIPAGPSGARRPQSNGSAFRRAQVVA